VVLEEDVAAEDVDVAEVEVEEEDDDDDDDDEAASNSTINTDNTGFLVLRNQN
jgi:hypothetical protein